MRAVSARARAGLIAPEALLAALDVFEGGPLTEPAAPLLPHPRMIATPHTVFVAEEEVDLQVVDVFGPVNVVAERRPVHLVTPAGV
ncbi:hypothetical protein [Fuscovulum ytuae]|uniref:Uncharacterized protein n=1 Tax=Fuscovulum ytuae TaxID=3042299 RepID=A0ABY8Q9I7_9RHOB|nr:hypothetical protein [Fuscovulum sp. YMD61]WGV17358.1 hypothetical protein QF092_06070 [Fuscovulum sp. YMD61]